MAFISVKFKKQCGKYNGGEVAGFSAAELAAEANGRKVIPEDAYDLVAEEAAPAEPAPADPAPTPAPVDDPPASP